MGSLYGYEVASALPLRRLNRAPGSRGKLAVEVTREVLADRSATITGYLETADGRPYFTAAETDEGCLVCCPGTASFLLEPRRLLITVEPLTDDADDIEHRLASSALCTMLSLRGDLAIHAAGVEVEGGAVIFCGPTRRGKSTLVRALGELGHALLGEDGLAIDLSAPRPVAFPGARGVRIRRSGEAGEALVELVDDPGPSEPAPGEVIALVLLEERGDELRVERLPPSQALALLASQLVQTGGRQSVGDSFGRLAQLLRSAPAFRASLPDDIDVLPVAAAKLLETLAQPR